MENKIELVNLSSGIVSAYVGNNAVTSGDVPGLIQTVHKALHEAYTTGGEQEAPKLIPAVSVRKSITPDYLICLDDGLKFKTLKRHLRTTYNLTPEEYRERWGLPRDYPMVAPNYAAERSRLAKEMGLGRKRRKGRK